MEDLKTRINLNIEFKNTELLSQINTISMELSMTTEQFILNAINKLLYDVRFIRDLRNMNKIS
ncbi:hypothetical protein [Clostridium thailandense]|uniref:hypothetical protein n=1 Tax=Clostridium thailandense TaxID=2794346 RepID=UPI00398A19D8